MRVRLGIWGKLKTVDRVVTERKDQVLRWGLDVEWSQLVRPYQGKREGLKVQGRSHFRKVKRPIGS